MKAPISLSCVMRSLKTGPAKIPVLQLWRHGSPVARPGGNIMIWHTIRAFLSKGRKGRGSAMAFFGELHHDYA